jgi:hypothetical protein
MKPFLPLFFLLIGFHPKHFPINPLLSGFMVNHQTILFFAHLGVPFGQTSGPLIPQNFNSAPKSVFSLGTVLYTKDSNAWTLLKGTSTYHGMLFLMNTFFRLLPSIRMLELVLEAK